MAVAEEERTDSQQQDDAGRSAALKAAGAAAATGAAAFAVQKVLAQRSKGESKSTRKERKSDGQGSLIASAAAGGWDAAPDSLPPLAENAAGAAGRYLAEHPPAVARGGDCHEARLGSRRANEGAAVSRGEAPEDRRALADDEGSARAGRGPSTQLRSGRRQRWVTRLIERKAR